MIYVDSSLVLAEIFAEEIHPRSGFWAEDWVSSRLLEYEVWNRVNARQPSRTARARTRALLDGIAWSELGTRTLRRALRPFPVPVRTLDALHLATAIHLRDRRGSVEVASYDERLLDCARALRLPIRSP